MSSSTAAQQSDNVAHALSGAGGGILSMALTYPLITLSTRAQVESKRADSDFLDAVKRIVQREGINGLYAGLDSALFGISVTNFVYYYWYEWTRSGFEKAAVTAGRASKRLTTVESMIAGAIAGSATVMLTNPIWVVNTRMTTRKRNKETDEGLLPGSVVPKQPTTIGTLLALIKEEGPLALFAGVVPALVLVVNPILQYTIFEQLRNTIEKRRRVTPTIAFLLGALGKLFATSITYPYITVKSRMHVAGREGGKENMMQAMRRVVNEEGYAGLYKGIGPKVTQSVLTAAFLFAFKDVLYEQTIKLRRKLPAKRVQDRLPRESSAAQHHHVRGVAKTPALPAATEHITLGPGREGRRAKKHLTFHIPHPGEPENHRRQHGKPKTKQCNPPRQKQKRPGLEVLNHTRFERITFRSGGERATVAPAVPDPRICDRRGVRGFMKIDYPQAVAGSRADQSAESAVVVWISGADERSREVPRGSLWLALGE
ncbi:hypothetical protein JHW43_001910 [Diplocarpon mali]|nr:hypothetical protein JHW43_001910 [Diplocarpon mali]